MSSSKKTLITQRGLIILAVYLCLLPMVVHADVVGTLNDALNYITGTAGKTIAALAVIGAGFGCLVLGKVSKGQAIAVVAGIAIIFGAKALITVLTS